MNEQLNKINDFVKMLGVETLSVLSEISVEKIYKKGDYLLKQDAICKKSYLIVYGFARKYYINDGKEITTELYFENDIAVSFESYALQKPSKEYIQVLSNTKVSQTDYQAFQKAKQHFPELITLDLMMTEYYAMWLEDRLFQYHTMDATARYKKLLTDSTNIIQNIPLTYIASYLGVSLETLSRIRAKQ